MNKKFGFTIPSEVRWDEEIIKNYHEALPYYVPNFDCAEFENRKVTIKLTENTDQNINKLKISLVELATTISRNFRDIAEVVTKTFSASAGSVKSNPFDDFVQTGDIVSTGRGKFIYRGQFVDLFNGLDRTLKSYCVEQGGREEIYPTTVQASSLHNSGYLNLHPHLAFFCAPAAKSNSAITAIGQLNFEEKPSTSKQEYSSLFEFPQEVLSPTVCYHCFEALRGRDVKESRITALNKCHRHEPVNVAGLSRLTTYWMRELILFDKAEAVSRALDVAVDYTCALLEELDVGYEVVSANDPFFGTQGAGNRLMQAALQLKREIKVSIGGGNKIAVASFNLHQKTLLEKFQIATSDDAQTELWSGCIGWGYERFLLGVLNRHGSDVDSWPTKSKRALSLPIA